MHRPQQGFTLVELMLVMAVIAILAVAAIPNLLSAKVAANQSNAIASLRHVVTAQAQFRAQTAVDSDNDGAGEYGSCAEMAGLVNLNVRGVGPARPLDPPVLNTPFTNIDANGRSTKTGYYFLLYLPDAGFQGLPEIPNGGPDPAVDANASAFYWSCYAWPVDASTTGTTAYYVDYRGEILVTRMENTTYGGAVAPAFDAALAGNNMTAGLGINGAAQDGNSWRPIQ